MVRVSGGLRSAYAIPLRNGSWLLKTFVLPLLLVPVLPNLALVFLPALTLAFLLPFWLCLTLFCDLDCPSPRPSFPFLPLIGLCVVIDGLGASTGAEVGSFLGTEVGSITGAEVGATTIIDVGIRVGVAVGVNEGAREAVALGLIDG